jgi:hypothetical protein
VLSAVANFLFIPYYPFSSLLIVTLDIFVTWPIAAHAARLRPDGGAGIAARPQ